MRESKFNASRLRQSAQPKGSRLAQSLDTLLGFSALVLIALGLSGKLGYGQIQEPLLVMTIGLGLLFVSLVWADRLRKRRLANGPLQFSPDLLKKRH